MRVRFTKAYKDLSYRSNQVPFDMDDSLTLGNVYDVSKIDIEGDAHVVADDEGCYNVLLEGQFEILEEGSPREEDEGVGVGERTKVNDIVFGFNDENFDYTSLDDLESNLDFESNPVVHVGIVYTDLDSSDLEEEQRELMEREGWSYLVHQLFEIKLGDLKQLIEDGYLILEEETNE